MLMKNQKRDALTEDTLVVPGQPDLGRLVSQLTDWICALDEEGRFVYSNEAVYAILGYQPYEICGRLFSEFIQADDTDRSAQAIMALKRGYVNIFFENAYHHKNGTIVCLKWSGRWDTAQGLLYATARDVSRQTFPEEPPRQNQQQLQFRSRELANVLDRITDGFFALDPDWNIVYGNAVAESMAQVKLQDIAARNFWNCFPATKGTKFETEYRRAMAQQVPAHFEEYYAPSALWLEVHAYPSANGLTVFLRDITEQKKISSELSKLSTIFKGTIHSMQLTDRQGRISWINDAFEKKSGYSLADVVGKRPGEVLSGPQTDPAALQQIFDSIAEGKAFRVEVLKYKKDGSMFWSDIYGEPLYDGQGHIVEYFIIDTDVTDRKVLEDRLKREVRQRQKKITGAVVKAQEEERALIGRELHDGINQVLTTAKLYIEAYRDGLGNGDELLNRSLQLVNNVIGEIRSLSKQLSAPHLHQMPLSESVQELTDSLSLAHKLSISLQMDDLAGLSLEGGFQLTVYRILQEHLTNVIKHAAAQSVQVLFKRTPAALSLIVADDGKGFNPAQKNKGIGLYNMKSRAQSLDGTLKINSSPGQGCTLLASFPLRGHRLDGGKEPGT